MDADGGYDNLSSISSSSDKQRKLIVKIEMAKYAKRQNDVRRREEEEKAAFERKLAEAEDLRKIQFAEVEAALWERAKTPSEQDKKSVVAYPQENFPIVPTPQDHLGRSNLPCSLSRIEHFLNFYFGKCAVCSNSMLDFHSAGDL